MIEATETPPAAPSAGSPEAPQTSAPESTRVIRIKPSNRFFSLDLREMWQYRELSFILAWRDIKVRYRQTALGVVWAVMQPFLTMVVFTLIFNKAAHINAPYGVPYPLFSFVGLLPWFYFSSSLTLSASSLVSNAPLVTKVYFPRLLIPLASITVPIIDFLCSSVVLVGLFAYYGRAPYWHTVAVPIFLGMALLTAFGVGLWLSALSVRYRDVPYALPFVTTLWLYTSPVVFPVSLVPHRFQWLLALNPLTGVIDGVRWAVIGKGVPHYTVFGTSAATGVLILLSGLVFFRRTERYFADVI